jgi:DNA-binding FrmR family transcriptional regulator
MTKKELTPREDVAKRLKIAAGHLKKIIEMVEDGTYCIDILQQTAAVQSALKKADEVLLVNHINHCLVKAIKSNGEKKATDELIQVFRKMK